MGGVRYVRYGPQLDSVPHAVVAGRPRPDTRLLLSNLAGSRLPSTVRADTAAEIALNALRGESGRSQLDAVDAVTCDTFHPDALLALWVLLNPADALACARQVEQAARASSFGVSTTSEAAQFACWVTAFRDEQGLHSPADCYQAMLPLVGDVLLRPRDHDLTWIGEYSDVLRAEAMLTSGAVQIDDHDELDLTVMQTPLRLHDLTRFTAARNFRLLTVRTENTYILEYRRESWVQYRSRRVMPRIDLRPLAGRLNLFERAGGRWTAEPHTEPTPRLFLDTGNGRPAPSAIDVETVTAEVVDFFGAHAQHRLTQWSPYTDALPEV